MSSLLISCQYTGRELGADHQSRTSGSTSSFLRSSKLGSTRPPRGSGQRRLPSLRKHCTCSRRSEKISILLGFFFPRFVPPQISTGMRVPAILDSQRSRFVKVSWPLFPGGRCGGRPGGVWGDRGGGLQEGSPRWRPQAAKRRRAKRVLFAAGCCFEQKARAS